MNIASPKNCTACMACTEICAHQALSCQLDRNGYFRIRFDKNACINCGLCTKVCPITNPLKPILTSSVPFATWNNDETLRTKSASGGAFSAIAAAILKKGGVVYGATISGFKIVHKRITTQAELLALLGSKYQQSDMTGIYKQIRHDLKDGKLVLFSGLACQVAGLNAFLRNTDRSLLYTIDTICGGLSTQLPMLNLQKCGRYTAIHSFRDKSGVNGWQSIGFRYSLKMQRPDATIEDLGLNNLVLNTFSSKLLKRSSCLDCKFTGQNRASDCTIGDFWGDTRFVEQHKNGVSLLILHNKRIQPLIEESELSLSKIRYEDFIPWNHNYIWTKQPLIRYFISRKIALWAMRNSHWHLAQHLMRPKSIAGFFMRLYLKVNNIMYRRAYTLFIKISK